MRDFLAIWGQESHRSLLPLRPAIAVAIFNGAVADSSVAKTHIQGKGLSLSKAASYETGGNKGM